jgi:hypothetical protein
MIDLRQRLSELDQLEAPDMRADIEQRISSQAGTTLEPLRPERPRSPQWQGPLVAAATAAAILLVVVMAAIAALRSEPTPTVVPAATIPPTDISVDSTTIPATDPWDGVIEVTFDGQQCVVSGPPSVPAGVGQPFVFTNTSEQLVDFEVGSLHGITFSELAAMQNAEDGFYYPDPDYTYQWVGREAFSFDRDVRPAIDLADNQRLYVFSLTFGTDVPYLVTNTVPVLTQPGSAADGDLGTPEGYWFCGQIEVTAIEF